MHQSTILRSERLSAKVLTKTDLIHKISTQNPDIEYENADGKNPMWKNFLKIKFQRQLQPFVKCKICANVLAYKVETGTGSVLRHNCLVNKKTDANCSTDVVQPLVNSVPTNRPNDLIKNLHLKQLKFMAKDIQRLHITNGEGFMELAQALLDIGAKYGKQDIMRVLASERIISEIEMPKIIREIKSDLSQSLSKYQAAFTADLWEDKVNGREFLILTCHFIDYNFSLQSKVLGTRELTDIRIGENIRQLALNLLSEYVPDCEKTLSDSTFVTDNGNNIVDAFSLYKRLSCVCHNINLIMQHVLHLVSKDDDDDKTATETCDAQNEIISTIEASRNIVTHIKRLGLNKELHIKLIEAPTRWKTTCEMLNNILLSYDTIKDTLSDRGQSHYVANFNLNTLKLIVEFSKNFSDASDFLSSDTKPTLNEVVLWKKRLLEYCSATANDMEILKFLKSTAIIQIEKRLIIDDLHNIALFLDPNFRKMRFLCNVTKENTIRNVKKMLVDICEENSSHDMENHTEASFPKKKKRNIDDHFREFMDVESSTDSTASIYTVVNIEVHNYINQKLKNTVSDILHYWKSVKKFRALKILAQRILNIPASSISSEFSTFQHIFEERRTQLKQNHFGELLFLHKNWKMVENIG